MKICELIDNGCLKSLESRQKKGYYPSTDAGACKRKIYMSWFPEEYPPEPISPRLKRIFDMGDMIHEKLIDYLLDAGLLLSREVALPENEDMIRGRYDLLFLHPKTGEKVVGDFKSIKNLNYVREAPIDKHVLQLQIYMHYLGCKKAVLIYWSKTTSEILEHWLEYDPKIIQPELDRFKSVEGFKKLKMLPPPEIDNMCSYCQFKKYCEKDILESKRVKQ